MKVVLDTNVLVAAFIARGACSDLFAHLLRTHRIVTGSFIIAELESVLSSRFTFDESDVDEVVLLVRHQALCMEDVGPLPQPACRDRTDDNILAIALASQADCIVTGDKDLLVLGEYAGIPIITPADFWRFEKGLLGKSG